MIKSVKVDGTTYCPDDIVIVDYKEGSYLFGSIKQAFFIYGKPYLLCEILKTLCFDVHYHAYEVRFTNLLRVVVVGDLFDYHVLGSYIVAGKLLVPLRHFVDFMPSQ